MTARFKGNLMHPLNAFGRASRSIHGSEPTAAAVRTYREIAAILGERSGMPISATRVQRMCRAAEAKVTRGVLADPELNRWLRSEARIP